MDNAGASTCALTGILCLPGRRPLVSRRPPMPLRPSGGGPDPTLGGAPTTRRSVPICCAGPDRRAVPDRGPHHPAPEILGVPPLRCPVNDRPPRWILPKGGYGSWRTARIAGRGRFRWTLMEDDTLMIQAASGAMLLAVARVPWRAGHKGHSDRNGRQICCCGVRHAPAEAALDRVAFGSMRVLYLRAGYATGCAVSRTLASESPSRPSRVSRMIASRRGS